MCPLLFVNLTLFAFFNVCNLLPDVPHKKHCLVAVEECTIAGIFNRNRELKSAVCFVPQFSLTIKGEMHLTVAADHIFQIVAHDIQSMMYAGSKGIEPFYSLSESDM